MHPELPTLTDILLRRAAQQPSGRVYTFLRDGETEDGAETFQSLDRRARTIAALLQTRARSGDRVLLIYPQGLEYIAAFFGCLYAGMVAVPAYPPRSARNLPRLQAIVADAQPALALTTSQVSDLVDRLDPSGEGLGGLRRVSTSGLDESLSGEWRRPELSGETLAFLQYTSGSTADPKGVMLSHRNLLDNSEAISGAFGTDSESVGVSWLPPYHDMGLIGQIINPLYVGARMVLMPSGTFLMRPSCWLQAVSRYGATHSGGPNFAYDLCVRRFNPETAAGLDLSSWRVAFNGAEPIRPETIERFAAKFAPFGFRREAFYPCYGLAEATLMVSCAAGGAAPVLKAVSAMALEQDRVVEASPAAADARVLVGSGHPLPTQRVLIVNPRTLGRCGDGEVGEVWIAGASVAGGYWNRREETELSFHACLPETGEGPFLRTGDLGFLSGGELFITGRLKDLIIICGRNLYPQDIEWSAGRSHPSLREGAAAAFQLTVGGEEQLVVVQEVDFRQKPDAAEVVKAIRRAVAEEHGVQLHDAVLVKPGSLPLTSSGKLQRHLCKAKYRAESLSRYGEGAEAVRPGGHLMMQE
jgi:acyl-CoA synthetase (AMP-forming)/AMP-acid ligase II